MRFGLGKVWSDTVRLYSSNLVHILLATAISLLPFLALFLAKTYLEVRTWETDAAVPFLWILSLQIATAAISVLSRGWRKRRAETAEFSAVASRSVPSILGLVVALAVLLGVGALIGWWGGPLCALGILVDPSHSVARPILLGALGLLCLVPGPLLAVRYAVAIPAAVDERLGIARALARSVSLTRGSRLSVFAVYFLVATVHVGLDQLTDHFAEPLTAPGPTLGSSVAKLVLTLFTISLTATATTVMYDRLRDAKEAPEAADRASISRAEAVPPPI